MARLCRGIVHQGPKPVPQMEELEPRLLLSADPVSFLLPDTFISQQAINELLLDHDLVSIDRLATPEKVNALFE